VCSPAYLAGHPIDTAGADPLAGHALLEALSAPEDWRDWQRWTGAPARDARGLSFGDERLTMEAAERGLGLAMVDRALAADALAAARLMAPLEPLEMRRGTAWFLVYSAGARPSPAVAAFREWLLEETDRSEI